MASGHVNRTKRPNTWLHRPACGREESPCQLGAVHTWHKADMPRPMVVYRSDANDPSATSAGQFCCDAQRCPLVGFVLDGQRRRPYRPRCSTPVAREGTRMDIRFWGTRGSLAKPGRITLRHGGNTSCVEVRGDDGTLIVLDCGTGAHGLGQALLSAGPRCDGHLMITHTHWDHIQGFPFFAPLFVPGNTW